MVIKGVKKQNKILEFNICKTGYPMEIEFIVDLMNNALDAFGDCSYKEHLTKYVIYIKFNDDVVSTDNEIFELGMLFGKILKEN